MLKVVHSRLRLHSISLIVQAEGRMDLRLRGDDKLVNASASEACLVANRLTNRPLAKTLLDIIFDDVFELGRDVRAA